MSSVRALSGSMEVAGRTMMGKNAGNQSPLPYFASTSNAAEPRQSPDILRPTPSAPVTCACARAYALQRH